MSQFMYEAPQLKLRLNEVRHLLSCIPASIMSCLQMLNLPTLWLTPPLFSCCLVYQGEVLIFNNRRMVHGRCAFECPKGETRHLQGAYVAHPSVCARGV